MKTMRRLLAITLLLLTLGLPVFADQAGQMETPKPGTGAAPTPTPQTAVVQNYEGDATLTQDGQMETTLSVVLDVIGSILALI
jgi:hypothetical protein